MTQQNSEARHTPGPWTIKVYGTGSGRGPTIIDLKQTCTDGSYVEIAELPTTEVNPNGKGWETSENGPEWREEVEANANLIVVAPDMKKALDLWMKFAESDYSGDGMTAIKATNAVIQRIEGTDD